MCVYLYLFLQQPTALILKVNIPLLTGKVPPGWTVSLVDNPGFGEAQEHITQIADTSLLTSSAYIYLLETGNIGGKETTNFYKELNERDSCKLVLYDMIQPESEKDSEIQKQINAWA